MARKKSRPPQRSSSTTTAAAPLAPLTAPAPATAFTANTNGASKPALTSVTASPRPQPGQANKSAERNWIDRFAIRAARILGSLQLAVILLSTFALSVLLGTLMEHWYSTKIAQELVYKAWWFVLLLGLLMTTIFFAAAKKWPWKRHQTGFIITHIGLITLLVGGILNGIGGVDGMAQVIDTNDLAIQDKARRAFGPVSQITDEYSYNDLHMLRIGELIDANPPQLDGHGGMENPHQKAPSKEKGVIEEDFEPGPLPWKYHPELAAKTDTLLSVMTWLRNPVGHSWSRNLTGNVTLEIIDYYPFARREPFSPAKAGEQGFPAVKVLLRSIKIPMPPEEVWLSLRGERSVDLGMGAIVEMVGPVPGPLAKEFLAPPALEKLGKQGVLVVYTAQGERIELSVDAALAKKSVVPGDAKVKILKFMPNFQEREKVDGPPSDPGLEFEVEQDGVKTRFLAVGRLYGTLLNMDTKQIAHVGDPGVPLVWYHAPDIRLGRAHVRGIVQFLATEANDPQLYFRSFTNQAQGFSLENSGVARVGTENPIWQKMGFRFRVLEYLPQASAVESFNPVAIKPGKETQEEKVRYNPAIQCRLTNGKNAKEFWVGFGGRKTVELDGRKYFVKYTSKTKKLGFEVKLERAEQTVDPGTGAPASYTSYVQLFDKERGINGERREITMNQPLEHRGFMIYQSQYQFLGVFDANNRPVSLSGFTVGSDPGLTLKYLGSILLAVGIFCMFYMKAYFFKPQARALAAKTLPANPGDVPPQPA